MKRYLILIVLSCLFISCNHSPNGRYQITSFKAGDSGDGQISEKLKQTLYGRQYDIVFDSLSVSIHSLSTHEDLTMKRLQSKVPTYQGVYSKLGITYELLIRREPKMFMRVTAIFPPPSNAKPDTVYMAGQMAISKGYETRVAVMCYIQKVVD